MTITNLSSTVIGLGLYTPKDASLYTGIPAKDIRRWVFGYRVRGVDHPGLWPPELAFLDEQMLSFHDLLEIRFVHALRQHGVSLLAIRDACTLARALFAQDYPFTCKRFQTEGREVLAAVLDETCDVGLIDLVKRQRAFNQVIKTSLYDGIHYSDESTARRWYLQKRSKAIVLDPCRRFGKPIMSASGIETFTIFQAYKVEGRDAKRVAAIYEVEVAAVYAAVAFEQRIAA